MEKKVKQYLSTLGSKRVRCVDMDELGEFCRGYLKTVKGKDIGWDDSVTLAYRILADGRWFRVSFSAEKD